MGDERGIFELKGSIDAELKEYKLLVKNDIEKSKYIYKIGEQLILLASNGEYAQFRKFTNTLDRKDILIYFIAKALMVSLIEGHLMISSYILDNGYPKTDTIGLPNLLNDCLKELLDYQCVSIVSLLHSKGFDINKQEKGTWYSPLHKAIERMLLETIKQLIELGADVNIVASNDIMPLTIAYQLVDCKEKDEIIQILINRGAKDTWRRDHNITVFTDNINNNDHSMRYDSNYSSMNTQIKATPSISSISRSIVNHSNSLSVNNKDNTIKYVRFTGNTNPSIPSILSPFQDNIKPKVTVYNGNGEQFLEPPPKVNMMNDVAIDNHDIQVDVDDFNITTDSNTNENDNNANDNYIIDEIDNMNGAITSIDINNNDSKLLEQSDDGAFLFSTG